MILNPTFETLPEQAKKELQSKNLQLTLTRVFEKTRFYQEKFTQHHIQPSTVNSIDDINLLPLTTSDELKSQYPYGLLTMPVSGTARIEHDPISRMATLLTTQDILIQQELIARTLVGCYTTLSSLLMVLPESAHTIGGRTLQQSAEMLGVTVIQNSSDSYEKIADTILQFGITTLFISGSESTAIAAALKKSGSTLAELPLMNIFTSADDTRAAINPLSPESLPIYSLYGHPAILSLGIGGDCHLQQGLHIHDDHFFPEIIDPYSGQSITDSHTYGELVITTLTREAAPILRYRTGQLAKLTKERCACGRTTPRIILAATQTSSL